MYARRNGWFRSALFVIGSRTAISCGPARRVGEAELRLRLRPALGDLGRAGRRDGLDRVLDRVESVVPCGISGPMLFAW
jgi:hypothetical protein